MKAIWYDQQGTATDVLQYGELPDPQPGPGEVRVQLAASGVNPVDVKRRLGGRGPMAAPRVIPHFDGAGVIDAVGAGVPEERLGERVWIYKAQWQRDFGTAAEFISLPSELAVALPENTTIEAGACLGIPAMTAHRCVFIDGDVSGKTVLVTGGAGSVGSYALQFSKLSGALTITTVSNDEKAALAKSAGADHVINYRHENVVERVTEITGGQGVDHIVEVEFGGNLEASADSLKPGGTIATYASEAVPEPTLPFYKMMYKSITIRLVVVFGAPSEATQLATTDITRWLASGELLHPPIHTFPLSEAAIAHEKVENGKSGKVLLIV